MKQHALGPFSRKRSHSVCVCVWGGERKYKKVVTFMNIFLHKGLSVKLQGRYVDVVRAHNDVEAGKSSIKARSEVDRLHAKIFRECNQMLLSILM